jgi:uncharacterized protein
MKKECDVEKIKTIIRQYPGVTRKAPIADVFEHLVPCGIGKQLPNYGDDAAVIPSGDGFLLLCADGMMTDLLINEPYAAAKASIMVCVNDIYSMGGRPTAMVNVLACTDKEMRKEITRGLKNGCERLQVPMVGGHLHPDTPTPSLSIATLGFAKKVMRSHTALEGQNIVVCVDLDGRPGCKTVMSWDANSGKSSAQLQQRLNILPEIAEKSLGTTCKDISNAGLIGTIAIMMENSGRGAVINLDRIPRPRGIDFEKWIICFQSYGFILSVEPELTPSVLNLFQKVNVAASVVGQVTDTHHVIINNGVDQAILFDFNKDKITGISTP